MPTFETAEHARLAHAGIIKRAGLARSNTLFAIRKLHLDAARAAHEPSWMRRTRRAHLHEHVDTAVRGRSVERAIANPVHVAQPHARGAQRLTGTDHDANWKIGRAHV